MATTGKTVDKGNRAADTSYYFTLGELRNAFQLVTSDTTANRMVEVWSKVFGPYLVDEKVVELPSDYGLPRLGEATGVDRQPTSTPIGECDEDIISPAGTTLIRFSDLTLTLLAGASRDVRRRFELLHVPVAHATLDDEAAWKRLLEDLTRLSAH